MIGILRISLVTLLLTLAAVISLQATLPRLANAQAKDAICQSLGFADDSADCNGTNGDSGVLGVIRAVLNILTFIAGILAVVMIVLAGMKFIASGGDSGKVTSARSSVMYAVIGIIVVVLSQVIVRFVIDAAINGERNNSVQVRPDQPSGPN